MPLPRNKAGDPCTSLDTSLGEEDGITEGDAGPGLKQLTVVASASQIATIKKKAEAVLTRGHGSNTIAKVIKAEDVDSGAVIVKLKPGSAALKAWRVRGGDFSQCKSEGGHALCPVCDFEGGAMPCQESRGRNAQRGGDPKLYASNCRTEDGNNLFVHPNSNRVYCFRKFGGNARWNKEQWTNVFLVGVHGKEKDALRPYGAIWITKSFVGKMDKACSRSLADPNAVR